MATTRSRMSKLRTPRARAVGQALRDAREDAGVGVRELARQLGTHHTWVQRVERAEIVITPELVATIAGALGLPPGERDSLVEQARDLPAASPWTPSSSLPGQLGTLIGYENEAARITEISDIVPGMLQTADYARELISAMSGPYAVADLVLARMGRQALLTSRNAPEYAVYLDEAALRRKVGDTAVMADQLDRLIEPANATVRLIPEDVGARAGWMIGGRGMGTLLEFADADPVVYLEHLATGTYLDRRSDTSVYLEAVARLSAVAMTPDDSAKVIASYRDQYERQAP